MSGGRMPSPSKPFVPMTDPPRSDRPVDHYEAALEASCDTLIALQVIGASVTSPVEVGGVESQLMRAISRQVTRAIRSQRRAITELRLARNEPERTPILGFVLEADVAHCGGVSSLRAQSRPRRTA
jgi:hypothetical protein